MAAYRKRKCGLRPANVGQSTRRFISFITDLSGSVQLIPAVMIRCGRYESGESERSDWPIYFCIAKLSLLCGIQTLSRSYYACFFNWDRPYVLQSVVCVRVTHRSCKPWELCSPWVSIGGNEETCPPFPRGRQHRKCPHPHFVISEKHICKHIA